MTGRLAAVTGASSGIGLAIAEHLLAGGDTVLGLSRRPGPLTDEAFTHVPCDLAETSGVLDAARAALAWGRPDVVVHAAGLQHAAFLGELDAAASERMWRVHVLAAETLVNALAPGVADGGRIVLIGSRTAAGVRGKSQYGATKAALSAYARAWASELAPRGITVNVVAPGPTRTPMAADPRRAAAPMRVPPLGRLIEPAEVAGLVGFLAGPGGAMLTGQTLVMCGGVSLHE